MIHQGAWRLFQCRRGSRQPVGRAADHGRGHGHRHRGRLADLARLLPGMVALVTFALASTTTTPRPPFPAAHRSTPKQRFGRSPRWRGGTGADDPAFTSTTTARRRRLPQSPPAPECPPHRSALAARLRSTSPTGLAAVLRSPSPASPRIPDHHRPHRPADHPSPPLSAVSRRPPGAHRSSADQSRPDASPRRWRRNQAWPSRHRPVPQSALLVSASSRLQSAARA